MPKKTSGKETRISKKIIVAKGTTTRKQNKKQTKNIVFKIYAPEAQEIYLAGDFNNWDYQSLSMVKREDGVWEIEQELLSGEYQYKYFIDGRWEVDNQQEMRANPFGTMNNIIIIN